MTSGEKKNKIDRLLVVGSGGAGAIAAVYAQRTTPDAIITVVTKDTTVTYRKPGIVKIVEGKIPDISGILLGDLMISEGGQSYFKQRYSSLANKNIEVLRETEVTSIDIKKKVAHLSSGATGYSETYPFDSVVLATGATATKPPIQGAELPGTFTCWTAKEAQDLLTEVETAKRALIVGVGFVGLETTEILVNLGIETHVAVRSRLLRTLIEPDLSQIVMDRMKTEGVKFITNANIDCIQGDSHVTGAKINGKVYPFDIIIFAAGAKPNIELGTAIGCKLSNRAYQLDSYCKTNIDNVYAAGNCADYLDGILNKRLYLPVVRLAAYQGNIAGINAAGGTEEDTGFVKGQIDTVGGLQIASMGHSSEPLTKLGIPHKVVDVSDRFQEYAGAIKPQVRFTLGEDQRLLGAQVLREDFVGELAFSLYQAISEKRTMQETFSNLNTPVESKLGIAYPNPFLDRLK